MNQFITENPEGIELFSLTPMEVSHMEMKLNHKKEKGEHGKMLLPVRQPEEILYKKAVKTEAFKTFAEEE